MITERIVDTAIGVIFMVVLFFTLCTMVPAIGHWLRITPTHYPQPGT